MLALEHNKSSSCSKNLAGVGKYDEIAPAGHSRDQWMELDKVIVLAAIGLYAFFKIRTRLHLCGQSFFKFRYVILEHKSLNLNKMGAVRTHQVHSF